MQLFEHYNENKAITQAFIGFLSSAWKTHLSLCYTQKAHSDETINAILTQALLTLSCPAVMQSIPHDRLASEIKQAYMRSARLRQDVERLRSHLSFPVTE